MIRSIGLGILLSMVLVLTTSAIAEAAFISTGKVLHQANLVGSGDLTSDLNDSDVRAHNDRSFDGVSFSTVSFNAGLVDPASNPLLVCELNAADASISCPANDTTSRQVNFSPVGIMIAQAATGVVPEPGSIILAAFGIVGFIAWCWRRPRSH